jgi:hypothetical protein
VSEGHSGLSHDMPEYVPNQSPPVRKARVYKADDGLWYWGHACPRGGWSYEPASLSQPAALAGALKHLERCL